MKFTKTVVAVAVTGLFAVPMAASAETTLSGLTQIKYQGTDADDDSGDLNMAAGDVRVAINTQQAIVGGLTGYGNLQLNLDDLTGQGGTTFATTEIDPQGDETPTEITSKSTVASDNVYVGVKGDFGDIRLGEIPVAVEYGQLANDIFDVADDIVDGISYTGTFGPVGLGVNYSLEDDSDVAGIGAKFSAAGVTFGVGYQVNNLSDNDSGSLAAGLSFAIAGFSIAGHYWVQEGADGEFTVNPANNEEGDSQSLSVKVDYGIAGVNLGLTYSLLTTDITNLDDEADESAIRLDAGYDLGGGMDISTRITSKDNDPIRDGIDSDLVEYRVQLTKNF